MNTFGTPCLLRVGQVATQLGVNPHTVFRYIHQRGLPHYRLTSGTIRVDPAELDRWLEQRAARAER
jgi:excisionase family DNA binding protein